jgi:NitT/TauT family transport system ATP-binding protein
MNMSTQANAVLQARDLRLSYDDRILLQNLDLTIHENEIVILLGPSGVGKSSLLRTLAGLQSKQAGEITLFGEALDRPHPKAAFVFQQAALLPWLTLERNVAFGLDFKHQPEITKAEITARVQKALMEVGLSYAAKQYPTALSGGMAQRAALARALAREPEVLLLDEPLGSLDPNTRQEMQQLLRNTLKSHQAAAVMVTHDVDEAIDVGDRIVLLGGRPAGIAAEWQVDESIISDSEQRRDLHREILLTMQSHSVPVQAESSTSNQATNNELVFAA